MKSSKFLIIGHGIAAHCLAHYLDSFGHSTTLLASKDYSSASLVSPGIVNPIIGKNLNLAWSLDSLIKEAKNFYSDVAEGSYHPINILRMFINQKQKEIFHEKKDLPEFKEYISEVVPEGYDAFVTQKSFWLDIPLFIKLCQSNIKNSVIINQNFRYEELNLNDSKVQLNDTSFDRLIFCDGYHAINNPYATFLQFRPARGELLDLEIKNLSEDYIYNFGKFLLPIGNHIFRLGATYTWDNFEQAPTDSAREELLKEYESFFNYEYKVINHTSGVRPIVAGRKPVIGEHPEFNQIYFFNGLGSKGALSAPYFAKLLAEHLDHKRPIPEEVSTRRFYEAN